ncbi:Uma2 family endonuclease [Synechococcus sp. PCC 7336]|uniref:Uma2 family endonuclease n=1 Tax=Synechococcus sp. PCC 7336 TaxID=195250 RepID=UPI00034CF91B|nr:Uma2 family endonuclease [Synechococcus sp. PCC 7336]
MVQTPTQPTSVEEFLALPETEPASEFIDGQILQKLMPQGQHSRLQLKLANAINGVTEKERSALALPELRCTFGGRSIVPDIAVFTWDRLPSNPDGTIANSFAAAPDWAIEILSPGQSVTRVTKKLLYCLDGGTQLGWLVDPDEQIVLVYRARQQPQGFDEEDEGLLPVPEFAKSLELKRSQLFAWLRVREST